jgi:hypothetical protein
VRGTTCTGAVTYAQPGVYLVTVTVTHKDGGEATQTAADYVVIYDPSGGFASGVVGSTRRLALMSRIRA